MRKMLMILTLALILFLIVGCQDREAIAELKEFKAQASIEDQNKEIAKRYVEKINEGNFDAFKEFLSADYSIYSPSGYPKPTSREKLIENYKGTRKAFPEFIWSIEDMIAAKDMVICRIIIKGIFKGEGSDLPTGEKKFEFSLITIMRMENGKVVEEWQEDDQLGFVRQLGMELKPVEGGK